MFTGDLRARGSMGAFLSLPPPEGGEWRREGVAGGEGAPAAVGGGRGAGHVSACFPVCSESRERNRERGGPGKGLRGGDARLSPPGEGSGGSARSVQR